MTLHMDYTAVARPPMWLDGTAGAARLDVTTAETLRLVEGLVRVTALGPIPVKGSTRRSRCLSW